MHPQFLYILLSGLLTWFSATAQEKDNKEPENTMKYDLKFNVSGRTIGGAFDQFTSNNGLNFTLESNRWEILNRTSYSFNKTQGTLLQNDWYQLLNISYFTKSNILFPVVYYHYDNNLIYRVDHRHIAGLGLSSIKDWGKHSLRVSVGGGYENTLYNGSKFVNSETIGAHRDKELLLISIFHEHHVLDGKIALENFMFYRQSLREGADYFFVAQPRLSYKVFKHILVHMSYEYRFENVYLVDWSDVNTTFMYGFTFILNR